MPKIIQDEFSALDISRQRRWALRHKRDGKCSTCGRPGKKGYCRVHVRKNRDRMRKKLKCAGHYPNAKSYTVAPIKSDHVYKKATRKVRPKLMLRRPPSDRGSRNPFF